MTEVTLQRQPSLLERPLGPALALDWEKAAYAALIVLAIATRFFMLDVRVMSHDESLHTYYSYELYQGKGFVHTPLMHGTFQFHALALTYALFGANDFTARIPAAAFGVAAVALLWGFRKWLGKSGAMLGALFMIISPYMLFYSRYVRNESYVVVWGLLMALALFNYMEKREAKWLYIMVAATSLMYTTKEVSYIYIAVWMLFLGFIFLYEMFKARWDNAQYRQAFVAAIGLAVMAGVVAGVLFGLSEGVRIDQFSSTATAVPADPNAPISAATEPVNPVKQAAAIAFGITLLLFLVAGLMCLLQFRERLRDFAVDDMLIVLGTFVLPQLTAFPVKFLLKADPLDYSQAGLLKTATVFVPLFLLAAGVGLLWDWKKWLICAGIFYGIFIPLFTTMFTNGNGFWTGIVGSLGYWLDQQPVQRGSQPWYFYLLVQTPVYEFLPAIGSLIAAGLGLARLTQVKNVGETLNVDSPTGSHKFPALLFIGFWAIMAMIGYSAAGEKMPWLEVHITLPLILLAGWAFGQILDAVDWAAFWQRLGWVAALVTPLVMYGVVFALITLLGTNPPFRGNELAQLQATNSFVMAAIVVVGGLVGLDYIRQRLGWQQLGTIAASVAGIFLIFLTARAAFFASYVNYDDQTEFINYASGAPGVKTVMAQVDEISRRTTDGKGIRVAYDDDVSWPVTWYMKDYPNSVYYGNQPSRETFQDTPLVISGDTNWARVEPLLGKRYYTFEYIRMWWPMQEYFNLDKPEGRERLVNAITNPDFRQAIFNIWFYRDYKKYGELTNVDYSLSRWPVADRMRLYIRKDVAAQLWSLGIGPTALEPVPDDPYAKNKVQLASELTWGAGGTGEGQFNSPRVAAVAPDGTVYVADTKSNRIEQFTAEGQFIRSWGGLGKIDDGSALPGTFNEVWGLAVDKDGNVFASDTWNHRVQKFTADGQFLTMWGTFGLTEAGLSAMWGPRGLAVDEAGNVYVADTGNKRILVFDNNGQPLRSVGKAGVLDGELDEPTGVAVAGDGRIFVADTWNQRVQVFSNDGSYLGKWEVFGWFGQSLDNKPNLVLDGQGNLYASDPEGYRVIVFNEGGQFLYTFGDFGADGGTFALPTGLAVGDGKLFVVDTNNNRVMRFGLNTGQ